jgi:4-hydroxybenzoate polyprenyltransferase
MTGRLLAYAQLVRLPNVFTAFADILLGTCAVGAISSHWERVVLLMLASGSLYLGGMVWNDVFDRKEDAQTRPNRPLPSGRISVKSAVILGIILLVFGIILAGLAGRERSFANPSHPFGIACTLAVAILLYDGILKRTPFGPIGMGLCRSLNVWLGLSIAESLPPMELGIHLSAVIGLYIIGVTWFARTEEGTSQKSHLLAAFGVMIAALLLALTLPYHLAEGTVTPLYPYLLIAFGFWIGLAVANAIQQPTPRFVQIAVKRCILGLVLLDAILATAFVGPAGLLIGLLLLPANWLGKWVYST